MGGYEILGRLLGIADVRAIERVEPSFAAEWAYRGPAWLVFGLVAVVLASFTLYVRWQHRGSRLARGLLAVARGMVLAALLIFLAEPILTVHVSTNPKPLLWLLFDGSESMALVDELSPSERQRQAEALQATLRPQTELATRQQWVQALLNKPGWVESLQNRFRLRAFLFDRSDGPRALPLSEKADDQADPAWLASRLTTQGKVSALGAALNDLARRQAVGNLAGVLVVSDFDQNAGVTPITAARQLGCPVFTLGVGPAAAADVSVDLQAPLILKKSERASVVITVRHSGLTGQTAALRVRASAISGTKAESFLIGERSLVLAEAAHVVELPFTPSETGRFQLSAVIDPLEGENARQNNRAEREVNIRDDFLRLLFVEHEPTWEWRFVKEVFHRDSLVGMRGFRTFLRSADPKVRENNELFLPTLTPRRSEFFAHDVIFLGDVPAATLSEKFCSLTKEYVNVFGGGLVIVAGPRFGPGQLAKTPLADMLPVIVEYETKARSDREFRLRLTPEAAQYDFMQLGDTPVENAKAWENLGRLPWYQPVTRLHPQATALAVHPQDVCVDNETPQPIVAIRRYGRGEVIYLAFNETWRLRRKYGERYYRQFWGQMIHRLGLSHTLGTQKRFVARTDRQRYQADDKVLVTVEAFDAQFEPLTESALPERKLQGELLVPNGAGMDRRHLALAMTRPGLFEARVPVFVGGEHRVAVVDPVTKETTDVHFQVTQVAAEQRSAVRNVALQQELAHVSGGKSYDFTTIDRLAGEIPLPERTESAIVVIPLWNTWLSFTFVVGLLLLEWLGRKLVNLP